MKEHAPLYKEGIFYVLTDDGVKQSKEGRRIPTVKRLFQESENSAKPAYIFGHMFGGLGILAESIRRWVCIPLSIHLHDGLQAASGWKRSIRFLCLPCGADGSGKNYCQPGTAPISEGIPSRGRISGATVMDYLRKHFSRLLNQSPELHIPRIIQEQQEDRPEICEDLLAS